MKMLLVPAALFAAFAGSAEADVKPPARSRQLSEHHYVSSQTFRKTVDHYRKALAKRGDSHAEIPVYGYRGVIVARFVADKTVADWNAIHVFRLGGTIYIYVVPREPDKGVDPSLPSG